MIECYKCKKKHDVDIPRCDSCGTMLDNLYKINYSNIKANDCDSKIGLIIFILYFVITGPILLKIFTDLEDFKGAFGENVVPNIFYVVYAVVAAIIFVPLFVFWEYKKRFYRKQRDSLLTDEYEICNKCGFYKKKNEPCEAVHNVR